MKSSTSQLHFRRVSGTALRNTLPLPAQAPFSFPLQISAGSSLNPYTSCFTFPATNKHPFAESSKQGCALLRQWLIKGTRTHTHKDYRNCCTEMREDTEISFLQIILRATSNLSQHVAVYFKLMNPLCDVLATWQCIFSSMGPHERTSPALQPQPCADTTRGSHQLSLSINCHALKTCQRHHQKDMLADTDSSPGETSLRFQAPCQTPP